MNRDGYDPEDKFGGDFPAQPVVACWSCARKHRGAAACDAFPEGVPDEIASGANDHRRPFPGDGGLTYLPREG